MSLDVWDEDSGGGGPAEQLGSKSSTLVWIIFIIYKIDGDQSSETEM